MEFGKLFPRDRMYSQGDCRRSFRFLHKFHSVCLSASEKKGVEYDDFLDVLIGRRFAKPAEEIVSVEIRGFLILLSNKVCHNYTEYTR